MNNKYPRNTNALDYCIGEKMFDVIDSYDIEKNFPLKLKDFTRGSNKKAYFKYKGCGHSVQQRIADKLSNKCKKCPYCLNRGMVGKSLESEYPYHAKFFDVQKNGITPDKVPAHSGEKYYFRSFYDDNEIYCKVASFVNNHYKLYNCSNEKISQPHLILLFYLSQLDTDITFLNIKDEYGTVYKYDIYMPKFNLIIELDGYPWHNTRNAIKNDQHKNELIKDKYVLIRLRDERLFTELKYYANQYEIRFKWDYKFDFISILLWKISSISGLDITCLDYNVKRDEKNISSFSICYDENTSIIYDIPNLYMYLDNDYNNIDLLQIKCKTRKIILHFKHPVYTELKWSRNVHDLWATKNIFPQKEKMCIQILEKFPNLINQVLDNQDSINEHTEFTIKCNCGKYIKKKYSQLKYSTNKPLCYDCLKRYRLKNLASNKKIKI